MADSQWVGRNQWDWMALVALVLLAFSLPFELLTPLWTIGPFSITNVELLLFLTLIAVAFSIIQSRHFERTSRYWLWLLLFVAGLLLSALLAPELQLNALKASLRLIAGILLALATLQIVRRRADSRIISTVILMAGLISALVGWWEISQSELAWSELFRTHITRVGSYLRLTGTFGYANQAAMYIEATLPFLLAAIWSVHQANVPRLTRVLLQGLLFLLTIFYVQAGILTLSRASFATMIVVCLLLAAWLIVGQTASSRKMAFWWVGLAGVTGMLAISNALFSEQFLLRLQGGNVDEWYRAQISAPSTLTIASSDTVAVPVTVSNQGSLIWDSQAENPTSLGARWINEEGQEAHFQPRWSFPALVRPEDVVEMDVPVTAPPQPGTYELHWDVVHDNVTWFGAHSGQFATTLVTVTHRGTGASSAPDTSPTDAEAAWVYAGPEPNRTTLWLVGLQMIWERPLLGIGMDNFRLTYGDWLGRPFFNQTIHTNNFYLEMLVSLGILGAVPFFLWLGSLLVNILRTLRRPDKSMWQVAIAAGLLTFVIHGFLDFFLLFNSTGLLFWLLVGLWIGEEQRHAHRV
jgi:hypothetical protein